MQRPELPVDSRVTSDLYRSELVEGSHGDTPDPQRSRSRKLSHRLATESSLLVCPAESYPMAMVAAATVLACLCHP